MIEIKIHSESSKTDEYITISEDGENLFAIEASSTIEELDEGHDPVRAVFDLKQVPEIIWALETVLGKRTNIKR